MQRFINRLIPFILFGIAMVAFAFGIILLAYLFFLGAIVGLILFMIAWIRERFFPPKTLIKTKPRKGQIIDSDDWKKL